MSARNSDHPSAVLPKRCVVAALVGLLGASPVGAQTWNAGTDSWFNAANWLGGVPALNGSVTVSNGGTASLDTVASGGATATPQLGSLTVGRAGTGTGVGTVSSTGVGLLAGDLNVGTGLGSGAKADGLVQTFAAGATATGARIGSIYNQAVATDATGKVVIGGAYLAGGDLLEVGQLFRSAPGSVASGSLKATDFSGSLGGSFWIVGNVYAENGSQVGSRSQAELVAATGSLALATTGTAFIGTTVGWDRFTDASSVTRINEARGFVDLGGTLQVKNAAPLLIGTTTGGVADGTLRVGTLDMEPVRFNDVLIGTSGVAGSARGELRAGSGDLLTSASVSVGTTSGGQANGVVQLGGALRGGNGVLAVGGASAGSGQVAQATGELTAAGGLTGIGALEVGRLLGGAAGSFARGVVSGGADIGPAVNGGRVLVGQLFDATGAAEADGTVSVAGQLGLGDTLEVAQLFRSAAGSRSSGVLHVGGDVGTAGGAFWIVGNVYAENDGQVGSRARGELVAGGSMVLNSGGATFIGTTTGVDRVTDAAGTRVNEATGLVRLGGTLNVGANQNGQWLQIGRTDGGRAEGTLEVGRIEMGANRFGSVAVGVSGAGGAQGRLSVGGGTLRTDSLNVGTSTGGGTADGKVALRQVQLVARRVDAGTGGGSADIALADSTATVEDDFVFGRGRLSLDRSLLGVGDEFLFGDAALMHIGIDGLARGSEYGAIDAARVALDGLLEVDFDDLAFNGGSAAFDIVRSGSASGITGDFDAFSLLNLPTGYSATAGLEVDGVEVYRVRLTRNDVPEPGTWLLALLGLGLTGVARRRRVR